MARKEHPCEDGLTPECFEKYPQWASQAFAYRLLCILFPPQITRRLQRLLTGAIVGPGAVIPPGVIPPPGVIIPPDTEFPPDWTPGDPAPPGVIIPPDTQFPPDWTPGDPAPPGVIIPPDTEFPPDWTPPDPLPPDVLPPPFDPGQEPPDGPLPPNYTNPWEPGPVHRPPDTPTEAIPWFLDRFAGPDIDWTVWTDNSYLNGFNAIVSARLKQWCTDDFSAAEIATAPNSTIPAAFTLSFKLEYCGAGEHEIVVYTGAHQIDLSFGTLTTAVRFATPSGYVSYPCAEYLNQNVAWELTYDGTYATLKKDGVTVFSGVAPYVDTTQKGAIFVTTYETTIIYLDDLKIQEA